MDKDGDNDSSTVQHSGTAVPPAVLNTDQLYKLALQYFKVKIILLEPKGKETMRNI